MNTRYGKAICGLILVMVLAACSAHVQPLGKLAELSRDDFVMAMRWKRFPMAAGLMQQDLRDDFMATFKGLKDIHFTDVRIVDLQTYEEGRRFKTTVEMDYYLLPSVTVKTFTFDQTWVYFEDEDPAKQGFFIVSAFPEFP